MHIAIDTTPLDSGHKNRGVGQYTKLLIESLEQYERKHSYSFFVRGQKIPENVDLVHYPYLDPFFITLPWIKRCPRVVTVHDLIPLIFPDKFPPGIKGKLRWQVQRRSLLQSDRIIADSFSSKDDIVRLVGYPGARVHVIHLAPAPVYTKVSDTSALLNVQKKYGLHERFVVYVGDVNWNKNILGLLRGLCSLIAGNKHDVRMVFVGESFLDKKLPESAEVNEFIKKNALGPYIQKIGHLSSQELAGVYTLARACVLPSFYEGFGLPILEAMACGCPAIVSRGSSLDEIAGPSVRIDAKNPEDIAMSIARLLMMTASERKEISQKSRIWAATFSWKKVAAKTVAVYEKLVT